MKQSFTGIISAVFCEIVICLFILPGTVNAQQDAMFSQYMFNTLAYNPAYAGSRNMLGATALYRNQWAGMTGSPKTGTITVDAPFYQERIGAGLQFVSDKLGITQTTGGILSGAYRMPMNEASLSFGMQAGVSQYSANYSSVPLDPSGLANDPAFMEDVSKMLFNVGAGAYYNTNTYYAGLSVQDLIPNKLNNHQATSSGETARQRPHAFLAGGYVLPIGYDYHLKASALIKAVTGAPLQANIGATIWIKDFIALGAEYRTSADISALMELRVSPNIRIGYAYDRSTTALKTYNSGSHEFMLRYELPFDRSRILSPRYF